MIGKFLDVRNDVAFKRIFGTEKNKDILIHFLNDMLVFKNRSPIVDVAFLNTIQDPEIAYKKTSIVDVLCKDQDGHTYIVEMQVANSAGFEKRAQYYAAKAYGSQMNQGGQYPDLKEVIFLAITDFVMFPNKRKYKSDHVILDNETHEHDLKDFSFTFLELPKFTKTKEELSSMIEKWTYFFKHAYETTNADLKEIIGKDEIIQRAYAELDKFSWSEQEFMSYEQEMKREMDNQAVEDAAKAASELKGLERGKREIAKNCLKQGMSKDIISSITGLSIEEIESLESHYPSLREFQERV